VPCHPELEAYLTAWTRAAGIRRDKKELIIPEHRQGDRWGE